MTSKKFDLGPVPGTVSKLFEVEAERDHLRAEVEALRAENVALRESRAEAMRGVMDRDTQIKRLRADLAESEAENDQWQKKLAEVWAENERLRAALTEITDLDLEGDASVADAIAIADEALHPPPL